MNWEVVWDIRRASPEDFLSWVLIGGVLLLGAVVFEVLARRKQQRSQTARVLAVFGVLCAGLGYGVNTWDRGRLTTHLERGDVKTVEGFVSGHQVWRQERARMGNESRSYTKWETISVGGVGFTWSPGAQEAAFTNAAPGGIAFRDGMPLRVTWVEDVEGEAHQRRIVVLEVSPGYREAEELEARGIEPPFPSTVTPEQLQGQH